MSAQLAQALRMQARTLRTKSMPLSDLIPLLNKAADALAALEAAPQQEPDCWAILTPNGSKLVSPDEAKGRKDSYPLYAAPQQAQAPTLGVCDFVQVDDSSKSSRSQHDADSAELRSLCKARDEARRERGMLRAELAGHEASSGHLSAMVDELRALLAEAMAMMKALHESASPDDGPEMNAIVPAGAFREFVDANAALMHKIHISPHGDLLATAQQAPGWQPIDTAPKDGRTVQLGYFNSHGKWRSLRGQWMSADYIAEYWEDPDDGEPGWYETSVEKDDTPNCWRTEPTHWAPLLAAPQQGSNT